MKKEYLKPNTRTKRIQISNLLEYASIPGGGTGEPDAKANLLPEADIEGFGEMGE